MTAAVSMALPSSRTLLGWWREISPLDPVRFWFAHLVLHRIEALVEIDAPPALATLSAQLPRLLALRNAPCSISEFARDLALDPGLARTLMERLIDQGLAEEVSPGSVRLTPMGYERAANHSITFAGRRDRRDFYFVDDQEPWYLPMPAELTTPLSATPAGWQFDLARLEDCLAQSEQWKDQVGFPRDVTRLIVAESGEDAWRAIPVDQPMQALVVLVETVNGPVLGLGVKGDHWGLSPEPALQVPADSPLRAALCEEVPAEAWKHAWQMWCQQRSLPASDVEASRLELRDHRLTVRAPSRLVERLRQARSDALRGEAWVLAGTGRVRPAAQIELTG